MHADFPSRHLDNRRSLLVWLPPGYTEGRQAFPLLYYQDGQNVFDRATAFAGVEWEADETAQRLIQEGRLPPLLQVAIFNTPRRVQEYTPPHPRQPLSRGHLYARFLAEEVHPFLCRNYRVREEEVGVAGSSLGGLISLYCCLWYPHLFSRCGALSPSLWWNRRQFLRDLSRHPEAFQGVRVWLDMGTKEGRDPRRNLRLLRPVRKLAARLRRRGLREGVDVSYLEVPEGRHGEADWAARLDRMLLFLFAKQEEHPAKGLA